MPKQQKQKKDKNAGNTHSGRSFSNEWPTGRRRVRLDSGATLAPRSLRKKGRVFLTDCKQSELKRIGLPDDEVEKGVGEDEG